MKSIIRVSLFLVMASYLILQFRPAENFGENDLIGFCVIAIGALSGLVLMVTLFIFWFKSTFVSKISKFLWLVVILFAYLLIGPLLFYLVVVEGGKTLKNEK